LETEIAVKIFLILCVCALLMPPVAARAQEGAAQKASGTYEYVDLHPLFVPVINEKGLVQQVSLSVSLECPMGKRDSVNVFKPRLMDAYLRELYGALGSGRAMMRGNIVDVEQLKARLEAVTERVVGPDLVSDVLLQSVQQHAMRAR
jgi:flagellar protein FliL